MLLYDILGMITKVLFSLAPLLIALLSLCSLGPTWKLLIHWEFCLARNLSMGFHNLLCGHFWVKNVICIPPQTQENKISHVFNAAVLCPLRSKNLPLLSKLQLHRTFCWPFHIPFYSQILKSSKDKERSYQLLRVGIIWVLKAWEGSMVFRPCWGTSMDFSVTG